MDAITKTTRMFSQDRTLLLLPARNVPAARRVAVSKIDTTAERAAFSEFVEWSMTGLVMTAVLLFGAGLVHFGVPACAARFWAVTGLYAVAGIFGLATIAVAAKAVLHLVRSFGRDRG
jgi:hypothetical protein